MAFKSVLRKKLRTLAERLLVGIDYFDILKAVENATVTRDTGDGKITSKKVIHYDFISGISVGCKYHQNWTETYRSGEAIL